MKFINYLYTKRKWSFVFLILAIILNIVSLITEDYSYKLFNITAMSLWILLLYIDMISDRQNNNTKKDKIWLKIFAFQSNAIRKAARGELDYKYNEADRARTIYGLSNFALKKSADELRKAWYEASKSLRKKWFDNK